MPRHGPCLPGVRRQTPPLRVRLPSADVPVIPEALGYGRRSAHAGAAGRMRWQRRHAKPSDSVGRTASSAEGRSIAHLAGGIGGCAGRRSSGRVSLALTVPYEQAAAVRRISIFVTGIVGAAALTACGSAITGSRTAEHRLPSPPAGLATVGGHIGPGLPGTPIPTAIPLVFSSNGSIVHTVTTNGRYALTLPPGTWSVRSLDGKVCATGINVAADGAFSDDLGPPRAVPAARPAMKHLARMRAHHRGWSSSLRVSSSGCLRWAGAS